MSESTRLKMIAARNIALGANLQSLALLRHPRKLYSYATENLFLYRALRGSRGLPEAGPMDVLGSGPVETVCFARLPPVFAQTGWLNTHASLSVDLLNLGLICRITRPQKIFEIGTFAGYTSMHLALNSPDDAEIVTLDLPQDRGGLPALPTSIADQDLIGVHSRIGGYCFSGTEQEARITTLFGDSATFDFSPYEKQVDLFFIDGAHTYEYVRSDTEAALRAIRPGGVIVWHDFGRRGTNGVTRWLLELSARHPVYAVPGGSLAFMTTA